LAQADPAMKEKLGQIYADFFQVRAQVESHVGPPGDLKP
jgi:hypothetical protein